jgi:hypothetical protein
MKDFYSTAKPADEAMGMQGALQSRTGPPKVWLFRNLDDAVIRPPSL